MTGKINTYSKEAIKARMMQNATRIWGLKSTGSIDPFVALLIDAFSTEIFKVSNEINAVSARVLEKIAKMLTPSIYTYPRPAHAIAFTMPEISNEILPDHSEFFVKKQFTSSIKAVSDVQIDMPFTPVDTIKLVKMQVSVLFAGNTCYTFDDIHNKLPVARVPSQTIAHNKIIAGIDVTAYDDAVMPSSLSLYCANSTFEYIDYVYKLLPYISVTTAGRELDVRQGITYAGNKTASGYREIFREYAIHTRIEENIKNIYAHKFIELHGLTNDMVSDTLPDYLQTLQNRQDVMKVVSGKKFIWLELTFPPQYTPDVLENFSFAINAFPVYNKGWKNNECALDIMGNNIPLLTSIGEHFLYVDEVIDSFGNKYSEIPFTQSADLQKGLYTIRQGGMERFNERNAIDMIANVLELTRDEVSAFGILDRDKVVEALKSMTSQMKILDQKINNATQNIRQEINYVIVDPIGNTEHLRAAYWVTHCSLANNIRPGTKLVQQKMTYASANRNIVLLTETTGGSEAQKGTDAIQAYKYALTTRDKIISVEDIKNFCRLTMGDDLGSIEVKRGTIISSKPKEGFIRTIEIEIAPRYYNLYGKKYWDTMAVSLKNQILSRAIDGIEYIVRIIDNDEVVQNADEIFQNS